MGFRGGQRAALFAAALVTLSMTGARADGPPGMALTQPPFTVAGGATLDQRFLAEYRAPHVARYAPQRRRGLALLGTGIALAGIGFVVTIAGAYLATDVIGLGGSHPHRTTGLGLVGGGLVGLVAGGTMITLGGIAASDAGAHERAIEMGYANAR